MSGDLEASNTHVVLKASGTFIKSIKTRKQTDEIRVYKFIPNVEYNCT